MKSTQAKKRYFSYSLSSLLMAVVVFGIMTACTDHQAKAKPNYVFKDAPRAGVVAKIGGQEITEDELMADDKMSFFDIKRKEYDLKMAMLNQMLIKRLLGAEAQKKGMDLDTYIAKNVAGDIKIPDAEYKKFVEEKKIPEAQINDQLKERIMAYLKDQKKEKKVEEVISKLTKSTPVEVYFKKPKMDVKIDIAKEDPIWGKESAPVTIVEFSDFQCPFCSRAAETVNLLKKKYSGKVRIAFKQFPLPMHRDARPAAEASMCVHDQSPDKFWKFHDLAFKGQDKLDAASLDAMAKSSGADMGKFKACLEAKKFSAMVEQSMQYGEKIGVRSTPTFFINGQMLAGALPIDQFSEIIDEAIDEAKHK